MGIGGKSLILKDNFVSVGFGFILEIEKWFRSKAKEWGAPSSLLTLFGVGKLFKQALIASLIFIPNPLFKRSSELLYMVPVGKWEYINLTGTENNLESKSWTQKGHLGIGISLTIQK